MDSEVKTAVIGVGSMGQHHVRVYEELENSRLVGISDIDENRVANIADRYGVTAYTNYRELLEEEKPDAVTIAVPTSLHHQIALDVLDSGADILIEKPIATNIDEAENIIKVANKLNRKLMVGHIVRFDPIIQALKRHLEDGELGRIFQIVCRRIGPFPPRVRDVGVVIDLAPHDLDLMRFITGDEPERVYAETQQEIHTDHEDLVSALLHFEGDVTGMLEINWLTPTKTRDVIVLGERGMFVADSLTKDLYFYENSQANGEMWETLRTIKGVSEGRMVRFPIQMIEPLKAELKGFLDSIIEDEPVPVTGRDGLIALRLALALVESGKTKKVIEV